MGIFNIFKKKKNKVINKSDAINKANSSFGNNNNILDVEITGSIIDNDNTLNELKMYHENKSNMLHQEHVNNISEFDLDNIISTDTDKLTSIELSFLKYLDGITIDKITSLPIYWTLEYNIDYKYTISKFFNMEYIKISDSFDMIHNLKMSELKEILLMNNLPHTARSKQVLIDRIKDNLDESLISDHLDINNRYFKLTDDGCYITNSIKPSITKDLDFENDCIKLIINRRFKDAYALVCKFELSKKNPRGIGIDWNTELNNGISQNYLERCYSIFNTDINLNDMRIEETIKSAYLLSNMLGAKPSTTLAKRLLANDIDKQVIANAFSDITYQIDCSYDFSNVNINAKYEVSCAFDIYTCDKCSTLDGKVFKYKDAKIGVNHPPFHKNCRCTTLPSLDENLKIHNEHWCRNPITGKSESTYAKNYNEWIQELYSKYGKDTILKLRNKNLHKNR